MKTAKTTKHSKENQTEYQIQEQQVEDEDIVDPYYFSDGMHW